MVVLVALLRAPTVNPAPAIEEVAAAWVNPTTFGTTTCAGPEDTTSAIALPAAACVPALGVCARTDPAGMLLLDAVVTGPTVRPAAAIADVAADCVSPTTLGTVRCVVGVAGTISIAARFQRSV